MAVDRELSSWDGNMLKRKQGEKYDISNENDKVALSSTYDIVLSGLSLVRKKEGLQLIKTDTQPERTQR